MTSRGQTLTTIPLVLSLGLLAACNPPPNLPIRVTLRDVTAGIFERNHATNEAAHAYLAKVPRLQAPGLERELDSMHRELFSKRVPYAQYAEDRTSRVKVLCYENCLCILRSLEKRVNGDELRGQSGPFQVYRLHISPSSKVPALTVRSHGSERPYFYHWATIFFDPKSKEAGVYDPIIFDSKRLLSLGERMATMDGFQDLRLVATRIDTTSTSKSGG